MLTRAYRDKQRLPFVGCWTAGMVLAAASLWTRTHPPPSSDVHPGLEGNLCRCTGYHNIVKSVLAASGQAAGT